MTATSFAIFDTAIGPCGIVWGERGITGVQLPMGSEDKTRKRIHQRNGDIPEAEPTGEVRRAVDAIKELLRASRRICRASCSISTTCRSSTAVSTRSPAPFRRARP